MLYLLQIKYKYYMYNNVICNTYNDEIQILYNVDI